MQRRSVGLLVTMTFLAASAVAAPSGSQAATMTVPSPYIVWSRALNEEGIGQQIVLADPQGGHLRELTTADERHLDGSPQPSPDGKLVAFDRQFPAGDVQLMLIGSDGRGERQVPVPCVDPCGFVRSPHWAPDGRHLVFTKVVGHDWGASHELWRTDLRGHDVARLSAPAAEGVYDDSGGSFTADGSMVFNRLRVADQRSAVFLSDPRGRHLRQLTAWALNAGGSVSPARSGPTRDLLVLSVYRAGQSPAVATARIPRPGTLVTHVTYLTSTAAPAGVSNEGASWSPDGRRLAYTHLEFTGSFYLLDIWTMRWTGAEQQQISAYPWYEAGAAWGRIGS